MNYEILVENLKQMVNLLVENRIEYIKANTRELGIEHDPYGRHRDKDSIIDHFVSADPNKKKVHLQWIVNQYKAGNIRQEDHGKIHDTLSQFEKYKSKLAKKDINSYRNLGEINDAIKPHLGSLVTNREKENEIIGSGLQLLHDNNGIKVYHLKDKEVSKKLYGGGSNIGKTDWCTADRRDEHNQFDHYNKMGKLYTIHANDGNKYQFHFESNQFMDHKDEGVDLKDLVKKHPELKNVDAFQGKHIHLTNDINKHFDNLVHNIKEKDFKEIDFNKLNDQTKQKYKIVETDFKNSNGGDVDIIHSLRNHPNVEIRRNVVFNKNISSDTLHDMRHDVDPYIRHYISGHHKTRSDTLHDMRNDVDNSIRHGILYHKNISSDTLHDMRHDKIYQIRSAIAQHKKTRSDTLHDMRKDEESIVRQHIALQQNIHPNTLHDMRNDQDVAVRDIIADNPNTRKNTLEDMKKSETHQNIIDRINNRLKENQ